jgi:hypothetical protein
LNLIQRTFAGIGSTAPGQTADGPDRHVVVAKDLAAQANAAEPSSRENAFLGSGHRVRFPSDEFDPAGRAPGIAPAGVKLIHLRIVLKCQNHAFAMRYLKSSHAFHSQARHIGVLLCSFGDFFVFSYFVLS